MSAIPRNAPPPSIVDVARKLEKRGAHIGVLSVHASHKVRKTVLLLVLVWNENGIGVEGALVDLKACFVCNPVAVSESGCSRMLGSGHVMDGWSVYCAEEAGRISYVLAISILVVVELVRARQSVGIGPKSRVYVRPGNENEVLHHHAFVWPVNNGPGIFGYLTLTSRPSCGPQFSQSHCTQRTSTLNKYTSCEKKRASARGPELSPVGAHNLGNDKMMPNAGNWGALTFEARTPKMYTPGYTSWRRQLQVFPSSAIKTNTFGHGLSQKSI